MERERDGERQRQSERESTAQPASRPGNEFERKNEGTQRSSEIGCSLARRLCLQRNLCFLVVEPYILSKWTWRGIEVRSGNQEIFQK